MRTNPEPDDGVSVQRADGSVADADAGRVDWWIGMDLLEPQAGVALPSLGNGGLLKL